MAVVRFRRIDSTSFYRTSELWLSIYPKASYLWRDNSYQTCIDTQCFLGYGHIGNHRSSDHSSTTWTNLLTRVVIDGNN